MDLVGIQVLRESREETEADESTNQQLIHARHHPRSVWGRWEDGEEWEGIEDEPGGLPPFPSLPTFPHSLTARGLDALCEPGRLRIIPRRTRSRQLDLRPLESPDVIRCSGL